MCLARIVPVLAQPALASKSLLVNSHSSVPVVGNFSKSGFGLSENFREHHDSQDLMWVLVNSRGSETSKRLLNYWKGSLSNNEPIQI